MASVLVLSVSGVVDAQSWLQDRSLREGPGIRLGSNLVLHPGIGVEAGYDTNLFFDDPDTEDLTSAFILRVSPHLDLATLSPQRREDGENAEAPRKIDFRLGIGAGLHIFFEDQAKNDLNLMGDFSLIALPGRPFSFELFDRYRRRIPPFTEGRNTNYGIDDNTAGVNLRFQSRGGVLQSKIGYQFRLQFFEGEQFRYANHFNHQVSADIHWRFLPNTSVFSEVNVNRISYNSDRTSPVALVDNTRFRVRVGLNGAFTPKLSALVAVGYGGIFMGNSPIGENDTFIAQAELRYRITDATKFAIGYERDYTDTIIGGWRSRDRGYLQVSSLIGGAFFLSLEGWVGYLRFGEVVDNFGMPIGVGGSSRSDVIVSAQLFAEYRFTDWLGMNLTLQYSSNFTDFEYIIPSDVGSFTDPAAYQKFQAWLGVRAFY